MKDYQIYFSEDAIQNRIQELAADIRRDYLDRNPVLVSMLKGSLYFIADLSRALAIPHAYDLVGIRRERNSSGEVRSVRFDRAPSLDLEGRDIIVLEEIVRSGLTANLLLRYLEGYSPKSLTLCALFYNPEQRLLELPLAYTGFQIGYERVIGYGMDCKEQDRYLPFVARLDKERYAD